MNVCFTIHQRRNLYRIVLQLLVLVASCLLGLIMYFHAFYSFYFLMFTYIVIDFYLMHVGIRLSTSTGMHLIPGLLSACLMIVKVLEEVVHCR
jgi:hypothetical protein